MSSIQTSDKGKLDMKTWTGNFITRVASLTRWRGVRVPATLATCVLSALILNSACAVTPSAPAEACGTAAPAQETISETRVSFTVAEAEIIVQLADNPTSRDFASTLPLTLEFEDFARMEKLSYLPRDLTTEGVTGSPPANGDLIYFVPWGNIGFFYDAERRDASYDEQVIPIGTVVSGQERLDDLETGPVCVQLIQYP